MLSGFGPICARIPHEPVLERHRHSCCRITAAVAVAEAVIRDFLEQSRAEVVVIDAEIGRGALRAFERFGRGRHPAALNLGDCFAYACARGLDVPLLFKGEDFSRTDIARA